MWTYRCYKTGCDPNLWQEWYDRHERAHGEHDAVFEILEDQDRWDEPFATKLRNMDGVIEVKFKADNVQWRVFGCYGDERKEFIVLAIGTHKQRVYNPHNVMETAVKRMKEVKRDATCASRCNRPGTAPQIAEQNLPRRLPRN